MDLKFKKNQLNIYFTNFIFGCAKTFATFNTVTIKPIKDMNQKIKKAKHFWDTLSRQDKHKLQKAIFTEGMTQNQS